MKKLMILFLAALMLFACAAPQEGTQDASSQTEQTEPTAAETAVSVPERETPDKSDLPYIEAWEPYRKSDWQAAWIRKTFTLDSAVDSATAFISAESKYTLWLNGELVILDGSPKRGPSPVDCYYDEAELTGFQAGENNITVLVAFNGRGGYSSVTPVLENADGDMEPQGGFLFEMEIGGQKICSDGTWKILRVPTYRNAATARGEYVSYSRGVQLAERNIWFDARQDIGDWTKPEFDDSAWDSATLIAKPGQLPFGDTYRSELKTPKFSGLTDFVNAGEYVGKTLTEDTTIALELPGNIQFTFAFEAEAKEGQQIAFYTDSFMAWPDGINSFRDTYVAREGAQSYEQYPWRSGSILYIEAPAGVTFTRLQYRVTEFNGEQAGSFQSSEEDLNVLWQKSFNTIRICLRDAFMDCPDRERAAYAGDAANEGSAALYAYDEAGLAVLRKALLTAIGWTHGNNVIPSQAPGINTRELPNQTLSMISASYLYWLHSGDEETMRAFYPAALNYLKLYEMGEDGLPLNREGDWNWCDWGPNIDGKLLQLAFYYYDLGLMDTLAEDLGITEGRDELQARMESIRANYRAVYYTEQGFMSPDARGVDDRANAMMVLSGLCEASDYEMIKGILTTVYQAEPFMERYILETLGEMGLTKEMTERMLLRYGGMIADEMDTLWERFDKSEGTFNHGWAAGPLYVMSKYLAGIRPTGAGWSSYEIAPADLPDSFSCSVWTVKGTITVEKKDGVLTVEAIDADGTVILPDGTTEELTAAGTYTFQIGE